MFEGSQKRSPPLFGIEFDEEKENHVTKHSVWSVDTQGPLPGQALRTT